VSLWFARGESAVQVGQWAGHLPTDALDTYGHVLIGGEVAETTLKRLAGDGAVMADPAAVASVALA
jgi:hypothetical protein